MLADMAVGVHSSRVATMNAASLMDAQQPFIQEASIAKLMASEMCIDVANKAIQIHGATGVSQWTPLAAMYKSQRTLRLADGPDEVHHFVVARFEMGRYGDGPGDVPMYEATGPVFSGP